MTTLFDELQIGSMTLKNRTFMAPMSLGMEIKREFLRYKNRHIGLKELKEK